MLRKLLAVSALLVLAGCASPVVTPPATTPPAEETVEAGIGVPVEVPQRDGVGEFVVHSVTWGTTLESEIAGESSLGGYLLVEATWSTLEGVSTAVMYQFSVVDAVGVEGSGVSAVLEPLVAVELPAGQSVDGELAFDIGPDGPYEIVVYDDLMGEVARIPVTADPR